VADVVDKATRSRMMAGIRGKNTKPEKLLRTALHSMGLRYRVHDTRLPGKPDMVFPKYHAVVLVHGCFWHRHPGCWWNTVPASNGDFWRTKLDKNVVRDGRDFEDLRELGWRVAIVWECSFKLPEKQAVAALVLNWLLSAEETLELPLHMRHRVDHPSKCGEPSL
jgi:DNA mismatch endonuclease (patch repair protein)